MAGTGTSAGTGSSAGTGTGAATVARPPHPVPPAAGKEPAGARRWARDLTLGIRFALAGGREGWLRTTLTAVGIGLGVALLLLAASVPTMIGERDDRADSRRPAGHAESAAEAGPGALAFVSVQNTFRDRSVEGLLVQATDDDPVLPPGLSALPGPGEMAVSPALKRVLESADGPLLAPRLPYEITAVIGDEGLTRPGELYFYAGTDDLIGTGAGYLDGFGAEFHRTPLDPLLLMLVVIGCAVLLLPVGVFVATAVRMGGERRDQRLSALRMVGADIPMTHRIAAGEALVGALLGLLVGAALFAAGRPLLAGVEVFGLSAFPADARPQAVVAVLVLTAVPVAAVVVTLQALRRVAVEPLGVVRTAGTRRRRLWWRLAPSALGLALLLPLLGGGAVGVSGWRLAAGIVLLLTGITVVLPWLVEAVVARTHGGSLPLQLAVRRLRLDSGPAARAVSGITVAVAGAIAAQTFFTGIAGNFEERTGADPTRAQARMWAFPDDPADARLTSLETLAGIPGVTAVRGVVQGHVNAVDAPGEHPPYTRISVGDCAALAELITVGEECRDGAVYLVPPTDPGAGELTPRPGTVLDLRPADAEPGGGDGGADAEPDGASGTPGGAAADGRWTVPADARAAEARRSPEGLRFSGVFATPAALDPAALGDPDLYVLFRTDPADPDVVERLRNAAMDFGLSSHVVELRQTATDRQFAAVGRALYAGAVAVLLVIGGSMVVSVVEQLKERRRLLAVLVAFGTPRTVLVRSVLYQVALPVLLGLALALLGGIGLGTLLLALGGVPASVPWAAVAVLTGCGAAMIAAATGISLVPLWRMMRPNGLRAE